MTAHTDTSLKQALAKMLPDNICFVTPLFPNAPQPYLSWHDADGHLLDEVLDTELLHLCWLVEEKLRNIAGGIGRYERELVIQLGITHCLLHPNFRIMHATWQQRTIALARVLNIEIV